MLISLGIESTAHTFGIGIVSENKKIYFNGYVRYETEKEGIHPREAAEFHKDYIIPLLDTALKYGGFVKYYEPKSKKLFFIDISYIYEKLGIKYKEKYVSNTIKKGNIVITRYREIIPNEKITISTDILKEIIYKNKNIRKINLISVSKGPGLYPTLAQGMFFARELALILDVPIVSVNHIIAHIEISKMISNFKDPVIVFVSGANTQIISFENNRYIIFGETLDIGLGHFLDLVGRLIGIGFPAGPKIEELASKGKNLIELPYTIKGMDIQLSGIYTHIKRLLDSKKDKISLEDLCFSIQEYTFSMLTEIAERALAHLNKKELVLTGGVAANKRLNKMLKDMCDYRNVKFYSVPLDLANDNGTMIAWTGIQWYKKGIETGLDKADINPYWRPDEIIL